jgi:hypothetical protein
MKMSSEYNIEELKRDFTQYFEKELPQRAKGIPYQRILGVTGISYMILTFFACLPISILFGVSDVLVSKKYVYLVFGLMAILLFYVPEYFYHEIKRSKRWVKRNYPKVYKKINKYSEKEKKDRMVVNPSLLRIEGKDLFFGTYSHQGVGDATSVLTGFVMLTKDCQLIEDEELFKKAFLTYNYSIIGAISGQAVASKECSFIADAIKNKITRAEKIIRTQ